MRITTVGLPKRALFLITAGAAVTLSACAVQPSGVEAKSPAPTTASSSASDEPFQDSSSDATESADPSPQADKTATFNQTISYDDGTEVEVIKVKHGKATHDDQEYGSGLKTGQDYLEITVRVANKGTSNLTDLYSDGSLTFGPDGDDAEKVYPYEAKDSVDIEGTIRVGKTKSALMRFAVPRKYQDDVQLDFDLGGHDTAVFAGSLK